MLEENTEKTKSRKYYIYYHPWSDALVASVIAPCGTLPSDHLMLTLDSLQDTERFMVFAELFGEVWRRYEERKRF